MPHPLLHRLIDYAGLFPPAELPLEQAFLEYRHHRRAPEAWMLGRFLCPLGGLSALARLAGTWDEPNLLTVSVILPPAVDLPADLARAMSGVRQFEESLSGRARVEMLECRVTSPVSASQLQDALLLTRGRTVFLEWENDHPFEALAAARASGLDHVGAKLRCGGVVPSAFPPVASVAGFIAGCLSHGIPLKATAGLHHPVRHVRDGLTMHGFLNVFGGAALLGAKAIGPEDLTQVVAEQDPTAFSLAHDGFRWRDIAVTGSQIESARQSGIEGFGSCSFTEPIEDLEQGKWFGHTTTPGSGTP